MLAIIVVPALGGVVDGNAWLMLTICPLTIAWPASAYTFWQGERLKSAHRDLARAHAQLAAAHRRLEEKASRDNMTGMLNRESFFAALDGSRRKADRGALLIIDADHFKKINDNFGHLTGDAALLEIAAAISRGIRGGDILGRIGGEEFGAFLVGASDQEAKRVAERIRREVELIRFQPADERTVPLTVSISGTVRSRRDGSGSARPHGGCARRRASPPRRWRRPGTHRIPRRRCGRARRRCARRARSRRQSRAAHRRRSDGR